MPADSSLQRRAFLKSAIQLGAFAAIVPSARSLATTRAAVAVPASSRPTLQLNVSDFGAKGDGTALDTAALQSALDRCNVLGGGEVLLPVGRYRTGSLALHSNVTLRLDSGAVIVGSPDLSHYTVAQVRWEGKWIPGYTALLHALDARNVAIVGSGSIEGNPAVGGRPTAANPLRRPALIEFIGCDGVHLEGFSTSYQHMWSIHPTYCDNVVIRGLTIRSTESNGDGIDVDSCRHVLIDSCDIATGDDCISLKSGRGEEAHMLNRPTEDVRITNCTLEGRGYACIGIGSETSGGIRNAVIEHCRVRSVYKYAIYIKSRIGRGAFVENITLRDMEASNMRMGFLCINQTGSGLRDQFPVLGIAGIPLFRNFCFENIRLHDAPVAAKITQIDPRKMLDGLVLDGISGTCSKGISIANARHVDVRNLSLTGYTGPLLTIANVQGRGLKDAQTTTAPSGPAVVEAPAVPYHLH